MNFFVKNPSNNTHKEDENWEQSWNFISECGSKESIDYFLARLGIFLSQDILGEAMMHNFMNIKQKIIINLCH